MVKKLREVWKSWGYRIAGGLLFLLAFATTIFMATTASRDEPPSAEMSGLLALLTGIFQIGSIAMFSRNGRPDDTHSESSVRRLLSLASRTQELSISAQEAKGTDAGTMRSSLVDLSARLNYIARDAFECVEDWIAFNSAAERKVRELNQQVLIQQEQDALSDEEK